MRRPDTGAQLGDSIIRVGSKLRRHPTNRLRHDIQRGSFFPGMYKPNRFSPRINQKHRATIGNIDSKINAAIAGDDRIGSGALRGRSDRHHTNAIAMNLFGKPSLTRKKLPSKALVIRVKPLQSGLPIGLDIETGDSQSKAVQNEFQPREGWKTPYRKVSLRR